MLKQFYSIVIIALILGVIFTACDPKTLGKSNTSFPHQDSSQAAATSTGEHQSIIDPETKLIYTKHARCRMECRHISEADIHEVLREGHVNEAKSKQEEGRCPAYAIEDNRNSDGIRLRIVFAKCDHEVKVVTCIDRDGEFPCDCK